MGIFIICRVLDFIWQLVLKVECYFRIQIKYIRWFKLNCLHCDVILEIIIIFITVFTSIIYFFMMNKILYNCINQIKMYYNQTQCATTWTLQFSLLIRPPYIFVLHSGDTNKVFIYLYFSVRVYALHLYTKITLCERVFRKRKHSCIINKRFQINPFIRIPFWWLNARTENFCLVRFFF